MTAEESIRDKIRKLLALANNEGAADNEAETAMRQANKLMRKHGIDLAAIHQASGTKPIFVWKSEFVPSGYPKPVNQCPLWFQWVGVAIGKFTDTRVTVVAKRQPAKSMGLGFDGDEVDVEYAVWLAEKIREEIRIKAAMYQAPGINSDQRWANREEFRHAMSRRICARLKALRAERDEEFKQAAEQSGSTALVVIDDKIKQRDARFGEFKVSDKKLSHLRGQAEAKYAGQSAGDAVSLNRPLENPTKRLS